jgi:hypothetical protein
MATATITTLGTCAGGDHVRIRFTVGANNFDYDYLIEELNEPISPEQRRIAISVFTRFHCTGMTKAETKTELQPPGISVVTS